MFQSRTMAWFQLYLGFWAPVLRPCSNLSGPGPKSGPGIVGRQVISGQSPEGHCSLAMTLGARTSIPIL